MQPLAPIHPRYLRDQAFLSLREAIVSGRLAPGDPLVIDALAETFGLSAMPVREAVKRLVADGLVEELPRRAHRIAPLTRQTALDVLGVMEVLMVGAYELGVPRLDAAGVSAMRGALERAAAHAAAGELIEALAGIHAMHEVVYAATGNAELGRVLSTVNPRFDRVLHLWYTESIVNVGTSYRADLVAALERGEPGEAVEIMRRAWSRFREIVVARAEEAGRMIAEARVVVVGGGIAGISTLYHLTRLGWSDVALVEADELTSGSTWHAAGLCTQFIQSYNLMQLLKTSVELYAGLEAETGLPVDFHQCGSVRIGTTRERLHQFEHVRGIAECVGVPLEIVTPERALELFPLARPDGILAAAHLPTDGHIDPTSLANALAKGATDRGATILRHTPVTALERERGGWTVSTPSGEIRAEHVVIAAGQWSREVGRLAGAELPIIPLQHHYLMTDPMPEIASRTVELPVFRDPDNSFYARQEGQGLLIGPFERNPLTWALDGIPAGFHGRLLPPDLEQIEDCLVAAAERIPRFGELGIKTVINGPDGYTPDGRCLMGEVPGRPGLHVLAGFSIFGIVFGGGAGKYAAEWIAEGQPSDNMWELDVRRFGDYARSTSYIVERASEVFEDEYKIHFPEEERPAGRPLKTDPLHDRLVAKGAVMGVRSGWERPLWFARSGPARDEYSFGRGNWFETVGEECRAVRSGVGVLDQTSFAKFVVSGEGAEAFLDRLCANRLPGDAGRMALTQMCTPRGGIEADVTVALLAPGRYYVVSAAATETHDLAWIERHAPADGSVRIDNVTPRYGVLTIAGPRSRELLERVSRDDFSNEGFRFFRARHVEVGRARSLAVRVSYVGELGWELHHPIEAQGPLYDALFAAGGDLGLVDFGYRALESMRFEKCYRLWGADMSADWSPLQAGLERFVAFDKGEFIGRDALLREREQGSTHTLACLVVDVDGVDAHGLEPIYAGADRPIAYVASGGYGHTLERSIALAYLPVAHAAVGTELTIGILGDRRPAVVSEQPLLDPASERLLS